MRVLLVDPETRSVREVELAGGLKSLQEAVGGWIEGIYPEGFHPDFEGVHGYVDEEGLFKAKPGVPWSVPGYPHLVGPGVFLCSTADGGEAPCSMSVAALERHVRWLG